MLKIKSFANQEALSLIEVMVAVSLISIILSALAVNMLYTQRTIANTRLRARAVDQANSCLDNFRNLRDSLVWWKFYQRLNDENHCRGSNGSTGTQYDLATNLAEVTCSIPTEIPAYDSLNRPAGICSDDPTKAGGCSGVTTIQIPSTICGPSLLAESGASGNSILSESDDQIQYRGLYTVTISPNIGSQLTSPPTLGNVIVEVKVTYNDFSEEPREVVVNQQFQQTDGEAWATP